MLWLLSCYNSDSRSSLSQFNTITANDEHNTLEGLDNLQLFHGKQAIAPAPYKIIVYFNGKCHTCISEMSEWKALLETQVDDINFEYLFITYTEDKEILSYYFERDSFEYPIFLDADSTFIIMNNLERKAQMAFIVDSTYRIGFKGNPIKDTASRNVFLNKIEEIDLSLSGSY